MLRAFRVSVAFRDGLGERKLVPDADGTRLEVLCLRRELTAVPSFEFALRERASRLSHFQHNAFAKIRGVDRSVAFDHALTVASEAVAGLRLSDLLNNAHDRGLALPIGAALCLLRQLVPAVAILHETARDAAHGAIAPERLIVGSNNRLVIVEHVLGSALEQLLFSRERYWTELRIALPRVAGLPRFDHLADVTQVGAVALQLVAGRLLRDDEYPARVAEIVSTATAISERDGIEPLAPPVKNWIVRALQLDPRQSFPSAIEARIELERAITESAYDASPDALDVFLARFHAPQAPIEVSKPAAPVVAEPKIVASAPPKPVDVPMPATPKPVLVEPSLAHPVVVPRPAAPPPTPAPSPSPALVSTVSSAPARGAQAPQVIPPSARTEPEEREALASAESHHVRRRARGRWVTAAAAVIAVGVVLAGGALVGARRFLAAEPEVKATGSLTIATNPVGAEAIVDGVRRGTTPVTIALTVGPHKVELRGDAEPRVIPITMTPGAQLSHFVDLPKAAPPAVVATAGPDPVPHVPPPPVAAPVDDTLSLAGWIGVQIKSGNGRSDDQLDVDVYEGDRLLGNSKIDRIMLPVGRHDLELVNDSVGLRARRRVQVTAGKLATIPLDRPSGALAINALPWAEIWVDGQKVGETPIGNVQLPIGSHEVVFRHPELGERQQTVLVTMLAPARISVDLRKP